MRIRSDKDIAAFRSAIEKCTRAVWLVAPNGEQINLKTASGQYEGIARLLKDKSEELELFTSCYEDEMEIFGFISSQRQCA
jgi:hypothetical protein